MSVPAVGIVNTAAFPALAAFNLLGLALAPAPGLFFLFLAPPFVLTLQPLLLADALELGLGARRL